MANYHGIPDSISHVLNEGIPVAALNFEEHGGAISALAHAAYRDLASFRRDVDVLVLTQDGRTREDVQRVLDEGKPLLPLLKSNVGAIRYDRGLGVVAEPLAITEEPAIRAALSAQDDLEARGVTLAGPYSTLEAVGSREIVLQPYDAENPDTNWEGVEGAVFPAVIRHNRLRQDVAVFEPAKITVHKPDASPTLLHLETLGGEGGAKCASNPEDAMEMAGIAIRLRAGVRADSGALPEADTVPRNKLGPLLGEVVAANDRTDLLFLAKGEINRNNYRGYQGVIAEDGMAVAPDGRALKYDHPVTLEQMMVMEPDAFKREEPGPEPLERIRTLLSTDDKEEFREACRLYSGINDDDVLQEVHAEFPDLSNYDAEGNHVGSTRHENGWTP